jgi:hypothetical protein
MIDDEKVIDKISVDLYNKKVIMRGSGDSVVIFKCSSMNELIDLMDKCKKLLKTEYVAIR